MTAETVIDAIDDFDNKKAIDNIIKLSQALVALKELPRRSIRNATVWYEDESMQCDEALEICLSWLVDLDFALKRHNPPKLNAKWRMP